MDKNKNKRGANYSEKEMLLNLVEEYKYIIESKETNVVFLKKKQETWQKISDKYNANSLTGPRNWQQLRHLYDNLKQKLRKGIAKENKEIIKTGGGKFKSNFTDTDAQVLALIAPQIKPLSNPYDDAALYFGDIHIESTEKTSQSFNDKNEYNFQLDFNDTELQEQNVQNESNTQVEDRENRTIATTSKTPTSTSVICAHTEVPDYIKKKPKKKSLKERYFEMKLRNAVIEKKKLIQKRKCLIIEHKNTLALQKMQLELLKTKLKTNRYK